MEKPSLLYVSPFWPMRSGISEYSEALIRGLKEYFELTLLLDHYTPEKGEIKENYKYIQYNAGKRYPEYDYIIYNFGNNPEFHSYMYEMLKDNPGYVILHDFVLYYLTVGYYAERGTLLQKIYELEGLEGILKVKDSLAGFHENNLLAHKHLAAELPLNEEVIRWAKGIIVHSQYSRNMIHARDGKKDVLVIQLVQTFEQRESIGYKQLYHMREEFHIPEDAYILGSVGLIASSKQNELVCKAVNLYNQKHTDKIYYVMVGNGNYVDDYLGDYIKKTGFLDNDAFYQAANDCDAIMNLRYPYNGEASATLIQCMDMKKICVVTDIGWFSELPNDCVVKTPVRLTAEDLMHMIEDIKTGQYNQIKESVHQFVKQECNAAHIARRIADYLISQGKT